MKIFQPKTLESCLLWAFFHDMDTKFKNWYSRCELSDVGMNQNQNSTEEYTHRNHYIQAKYPAAFHPSEINCPNWKSFAKFHIWCLERQIWWNLNARTLPNMCITYHDEPLMVSNVCHIVSIKLQSCFWPCHSNNISTLKGVRNVQNWLYDTNYREC